MKSKIQEPRRTKNISPRARTTHVQNKALIIETGRSEKKQYVDIYNTLSWVYVCVFEIANSIKSLPVKAFKYNSQNELKEIPLPLYIKKPNPMQRRRDFWEMHFGFLELTGESYWEISTKNNKPEFYIIPPQHMKPIPDAKDYVSGYIYNVNGKKIRYEANEVRYWKYFNPANPWAGTSPIQSVELAVGTDLYAQKYNARFFKNDSTPGGAYSTERSLSSRQYRRLQSQLILKRRGIDHAHKDIILENGLKYSKLQVTPADMAFLEQRKFNREEILAAFGVPPAVVGIFEYANYANADMQERIYWQKTLIPKITNFEENLSDEVSIIEDEEIVIKHDLTVIDALKGEFNATIESTTKAHLSGLFTRNEARAVLNKELYLGLSTNDKDGDTFILPLNMVPVGESKSVSTKSVQTKSMPEHTDEEIGVIWERAAKLVQPFENKFLIAAKKLFKFYEKFVIDGIESLNKDFMEAVNDFHTVWKTGTQKLAKDKIESAILSMLKFDLDFTKIFPESGVFADEYQKLCEPIYNGVALSIGQDLFEQLNIGAEFNATDPMLKKWIGDRMLTYSKTIEDDIKAKLTSQLMEGYELQETQAQLAKRVKEWFLDATNWRSATIARTEVNSAANNARRNASGQAIENGVPIKMKRWVDSRDGSVRPEHQAERARGWIDYNDFYSPGGDDMLQPCGGSDPGQNINCFPTNTFIKSPFKIKTAFKRWYNGEMISIETATGVQLTGTPNHPILTDQGWLALDSVKNGTNVICGVPRKKIGFCNPYINYYPSVIGKIFDFLYIAGTFKRVCGSNEQFHGDGMASNVNVISIDSKLKRCINFIFRKPTSKLFFTFTNFGKRFLFGNSFFNQFVFAGWLRSSGKIGFLGNSFQLFRCGISESDNICLRAISRSYIVIQQKTSYKWSRISKFFRKLQFRFSIKVSTDNVVKVHRYDFAGHVCNLHTSSGYYLANGNIQKNNDNTKYIVAHNCRCSEVYGIETQNGILKWI